MSSDYYHGMDPLTSDVVGVLSKLQAHIRATKLDFPDSEVLLQCTNLLMTWGIDGTPIEEIMGLFPGACDPNDKVFKLLGRLNRLLVKFAPPRVAARIYDDIHDLSKIGKVVFPTNLDDIENPIEVILPWQKE